MGVIKEDTRSLDYSSCEPLDMNLCFGPQNPLNNISI